jgi:hypothetical protein
MNPTERHSSALCEQAPVVREYIELAPTISPGKALAPAEREPTFGWTRYPVAALGDPIDRRPER